MNSDAKGVYLVVGSGPAGVAAASALLERNLKVLMLDVGLDIEPEIAASLVALNKKPIAQWSADDMRVIKGNTQLSTGGVPLKYVFGSDYPYRSPSDFSEAGQAVGLKASFARGGLSNVWGSAILPFNENDLTDWPLSRGDMDAHYTAVTKLFQVAGTKDSLSEAFPLYTSDPVDQTITSQTRRLLWRLSQHGTNLAARGLLFGRSRLALNRAPFASPDGCTYCGLCMYGCPTQQIYSSKSTLLNLKQNPNFEYRPGHVVHRVREIGSEVRVEGRRSGGHSFSIPADRCLLAAGVIPTTAIVAASTGGLNGEYRILDSQYFLQPTLTLPGSHAVHREAVNTLCQAYLELQNEDVDPRSIHLQVYSFNEMYRDLLKQMAGPLRDLLAWPINFALGNLMLVQGYLNSRSSSQISMRVQEDGGVLRVDLDPVINPETHATIRRVRRFLWRQSHRTGLFPISFMTKVATVGRGFHSGGTLPMSKTPGAQQTDLVGRPYGLQRVHCVDSTVFPTIPATTITYSVMANSHRIATHA